jgi:cardiolipin synthase
MIPDCVVTSLSGRRSGLVDIIRGARRSLALSLFRCDDEAILAELEGAVGRGVAVEALITSRAKGGADKLRALAATLAGIGVSVHAFDDAVVKYHAKYLIVDDGPAVVASFNFTRKCFKKTCDAFVVTHDPDVVAGLRTLMAADRERRPLPPDVSTRLIVGPERARRQFTAILEQAQSSIRLIDAKLSDPDLASLLEERRADGVTVELFNAKRLGELKSHGKMLLVDDRLAVVGGLAMTALSLDFRREIAIIVEQPGAVAEVRRLFDEVSAVTQPAV